RFVQFCACRKATKVIWRIVGTLRNLERAADRDSTYALNGAQSHDPLASLRSSRPKAGRVSPTYGIERIVGKPSLSRVRTLRLPPQVGGSGRSRVTDSRCPPRETA